MHGEGNEPTIAQTEAQARVDPTVGMWVTYRTKSVFAKVAWVMGAAQHVDPVVAENRPRSNKFYEAKKKFESNTEVNKSRTRIPEGNGLGPEINRALHSVAHEGKFFRSHFVFSGTLM